MDRVVFFDGVRASLFGGRLTEAQVDGMNALLDAFAGQPLAYQAYELATAFHETGQAMQPVEERGGAAYYMRKYDVTGENPERARQMGNTEPGDGARYYGRGYVQLTWKDNYARAGAAIGVDLVANPDLALEPVHAARILVRGMTEGWFTGRKMADYLGGAVPDYVEARRIVNLTDRAELIAGYAYAFEEALRLAQIRVARAARRRTITTT